MIKVITYGTYDLLHFGHIRLLKRAKALGDYLIVGITSDDYDKTRGKINNQQSLIERIAAVKATGIADEIIVEEYEGQKIDDIRRYNVDIFTVGSDWEGKFDYLNEYCKVVYLPRTEGVSSTELRTEKRKIKIGVIGKTQFQKKLISESRYVNGVEVVATYTGINDNSNDLKHTESYEELLGLVDAVYIVSHPDQHYQDIKKALLHNKHVLCESPISYSLDEAKDLYQIADNNNLILMEAIKTAYSTAYERLVLLAKTGVVGKVVSVDAVCTSLKDNLTENNITLPSKWNSICAWGPTALLPVFNILGTNYKTKFYFSHFIDPDKTIDACTKIVFLFDDAIASVKIAKGAKSEGELVISGTQGYIYVQAPWWKTDYFEIRFENPQNNKRFFFQLEGEGIRNMLVEFTKSIEFKNKKITNISQNISYAITAVMEDFKKKANLFEF